MASTSTGAATRAYTIDPAHSSAHFSVRHLMIAKVRGAFDRLSGTIELPAGSSFPVSIKAEIEAASINTRDAQRDGHLKSADFFEVETFPKLTFTSTRIETTGATRFRAHGDLEIHGVTRPVTIDAEVSGQGKDPWGNDRVAFEASARISRKDFGLVWNQALEAGGVAVGDEIDITLDVESIPSPA